ncbi:hypothetical protein L1887_12247 [Cichorium endivia]|nr:hypothetical protein L1887_12247 [Cichorium endivia]
MWLLLPVFLSCSVLLVGFFSGVLVLVCGIVSPVINDVFVLFGVQLPAGTFVSIKYFLDVQKKGTDRMSIR